MADEVTVSPTSLSVSVSGTAPSLGGASSLGVTSTQLNYVFNNAVNEIQDADTDSRVWGNAILGGGNSVYPNKILGYSSLRTICGGYNNIIGTLGTTDENETINSQILAGSHGRIVSLLDSATTKVSHGTIAGGAFNEIRNGDYGIILGGRNNIVQEKEGYLTPGEYATVANGFCAIVGGYGNTAYGYGSGVFSGINNISECKTSAVVGGQSNAINMPLSLDGGIGNPANATMEGSFIGGGYQNQMNAAGLSVIVGGSLNIINEIPAGDGNSAGSYLAIGGGRSNKIARSSSGFPLVTDCSYSVIAGGYGNLVNNYAGTILGGQDNQVQATYATAFGRDGRARIAGALTQGGQKFSAVGDAQTSVLAIKCQTTNNTATTMTSMGSAPVIPTDTTWTFRAIIAARNTNNSVQESAAYEVIGCIDNHAGTVGFVGTPSVTVVGEDVAGWDVSVSTASAELRIQATGENSKTINWVGRLELAEVTG
jgi:hypothetical protein